MEFDHFKRATNGNTELEGEIRDYVDLENYEPMERPAIMATHDKLSLDLLAESESYPTFQHYDSMRVVLLNITETTLFRLRALDFNK